MLWHKFKYLALTLTVPGSVLLSFYLPGWWSFTAVLYGFLLIPLCELFFSGQHTQWGDQELVRLKQDSFYDWLLYAMVPIQYLMLILFLAQLPHRSDLELVGTIIAFGMACGTVGINCAHELGHRGRWMDTFLSKALLLTSLYLHFFIEHNQGHHLHVATPKDPASSRKGETIYRFWVRSVVMSYLSAWSIEAGRLRKKGLSLVSLRNRMLQFSLIQVVFLSLVYFAAGDLGLAGVFGAACLGILMLETVNYIEHYGLQRAPTSKGQFAKVQIHHSWNSNHPLGRAILFEVSRHSDHHAHAGKKYQTLQSYPEGPQMPTGYPGMMLLSLVPPLWFRVMHPRLARVQASHPTISRPQAA